MGVGSEGRNALFVSLHDQVGIGTAAEETDGKAVTVDDIEDFSSAPAHNVIVLAAHGSLILAKCIEVVTRLKAHAPLGLRCNTFVHFLLRLVVQCFAHVLPLLLLLDGGGGLVSTCTTGTLACSGLRRNGLIQIGTIIEEDVA